ncbi:PepSY1/2 domain-containing protein [Lentibacillus cibarius]|uniref:SLH domain-containing protein n=1 Tax=Lentibacillus cibarius TaxID=2583219 RepID=A0A5S3QIV8_9BACI|nr:PepSY1/2 domain-containing protein [Lentibacillus cibarius]TMN21795.1 hypothetical protein FFL34_06475 [Lentibacillus cibarius]
MKFNRLGVTPLAASLLIAGMPLAASAATPAEQAEQSPAGQYHINSTQVVEVSDADKEVDVKKLIDRLQAVAPGQFDVIGEDDVRVRTSYRYPEGQDEKIVQYRVSINKEVDGERMHASASFAGDDLHLEHFNYRTPHEKEALFPAKVSKDEAQSKASSVVDQLTDDATYHQTDSISRLMPTNQSLTEPIEYRFQYERLEQDIPVAGDTVTITILGNGEISSVHKGMNPSKDVSYEDPKQTFDQEKALKRIKDNIQLGLHYVVDSRSEGAKAQLMYNFDPAVTGIHATDGKFSVNGEFVEDIPEADDLKPLKDEPADVESEPISKDEAKERAEKLLQNDDDDTKLRIESVRERQNRSGQTVYSVNYSYQTGSSTFGSSVSINKADGEVVQYHDIYQLRMNDGEDVEKNLSSEEALDQAVEAIKEYAPSKLNQYAEPVVKPEDVSSDGAYSFQFPRVHDGIRVIGDDVHVSISAEDGKVIMFNADTKAVKEWPSKEDAVDKKQAREDFLEDLGVSLVYMSPQALKANPVNPVPYNVSSGDGEYKLIYQPDLGHDTQTYDAIKGKWMDDPRLPNRQEGSDIEVSHPWAEDELNFMIKAGIIQVDDPESVKPDAPLSKGKALNVLVRSLTQMPNVTMPGPGGPSGEQQEQTFDNIAPGDDLYQIVERAADRGIINTQQDTFPVDEKLTRQELAAWYIRTLGLDAAAKHGDLYKLDFADANAIDDDYKGYVALSQALGLLQGDESNNFQPKDNTTLAELAVSNTQLVKRMFDNDIRPRY